MGRLGEVPLGLLVGVISMIFKKGLRVDPGNYRPITVLNTDYRVLAKVLANRLRAVIGKVIPEEQTGFVPGRHIGENVMLLQLLPTAMEVHSKAATVFCDFSKAYDTVDREFLFAVMAQLGVGEGFLKWVRLLLSDTAAAACVNGYVSEPVSSSAGVRQGCPLSPFLYLFVGQALCCFLKAQGFGVQVRGRCITLSQFADDTQVHLADMFSDLPRLQGAMQVFKAASGQGLNASKTLVLPIGRGARQQLWEAYYLSELQRCNGRRLGPQQQGGDMRTAAQQLARNALAADKTGVPPGVQMQGFKVVRSATALGVTFHADGSVSADWEALLEKVLKAYKFISCLHLSTFGRAFAAAGYGVSRLLYAAEFVGLPPAHVIAQLEQATAKLVDRGMAPEAPGRRFAGVAGPLLVGHPQLGGFGAMPWQQHILARHALWAVRLINGNNNTPWVHVARACLVPVSQHDDPGWQRMAIASCGASGTVGPTGQPLGPALQRLVHGLQALPSWQDASSAPLTPGSWCANVPLWCNPVLAAGGVPGPLPKQGLEARFGLFAELPTMRTLKDAVTAWAALGQVRTLEEYSRPRFGVWDKWFGHGALYQDWGRVQQQLGALVGAIPLSWVRSVNIHTVDPSPAEVLDGMMLPRISWAMPGSSRHFVTLRTMRVKQATRLQLQPVLDARAAKHTAFLQLACTALPPAEQASPGMLVGLLHRVWALPWDNERKEVYWKLTLDGLPTAARMHQPEAEPCNCGTRMPDRAHHFWDCPVAQAVRGEIERGLARLEGVPALARHHLWLCRPPCAALHSGVWMVVCLAALHAMNRGRKVLVAWRLAVDLGGQQAAGARQRAPPPLPQRIPVACRVAVAGFWDMLADFVGLGLWPVDWLADVSDTHPFLKVVVPSGPGSRTLRLHRV